MGRFTLESWSSKTNAPARRGASAAYGAAVPPSQRLVSLDALRGFTMFWLIGGAELARALGRCISPGVGDFVETQTLHAKWTGVAAWDFIGPMFLFVVGAAMPFAVGRRVEQGESRRTTYGRIARRVAVLWLLGMVAQRSILEYRLDRLELYSNTLQAIAVGYLVAAIALLHLRVRGQIALFGVLSLGYWALLALAPFGGHPAGVGSRGKLGVLRRSGGVGELSPRPPFYLGGDQPRFFGHGPVGRSLPASCCGRGCRPARSSSCSVRLA